MVKIGLLFLIVLIGVMGGCTTKVDVPPHEEVESKAEEVLGVNIYIPEHPKYVIGASAIGYGRDLSNIEELKRGKPNSISVEYFIETVDRLDFTEEMIAEVEKANLIEFIHNEQFNAGSIISLSVVLNLNKEPMYYKEIEIEGKTVNYEHVVADESVYESLDLDPNDVAMFFVEFDDFAYDIIYRLKDGNTFDDAKQFVASIIKKIN